LKKDRSEIPKEVAARVLFLADRTCCVCRTRGKPVQIHHIDEDPSNSVAVNLAVLCFDCHRDTQIHGGFDRKLDADQVVLYRDDWTRLVVQQRAREEAREYRSGRNVGDVELATSLAEIYRDAEAYDLLAMHYDIVGNNELRDKYVDLAITRGLPDGTLIFLRGLQGRPELIPPEVLERERHHLSSEGDLLQRGRLLDTVGDSQEAATDYLRGILDRLNGKRFFTAAYYLKELAESGLVDELFVLALRDAQAEKSLWWQVRSLQELGWDTELKALVEEHAAEIEASDDLLLKEVLARLRGDQSKYRELRKQLAREETEVADEQGDQ
jgi:hypothetical protein